MTAYSYFIHSQHHLLHGLLPDRTHYSYNLRSMTYDFKVTFYRDDRNVVILLTEYCLESIQTLLTYRKTHT